jgi:pimeloyl-ACP methyl ester carboxylesterase
MPITSKHVLLLSLLLVIAAIAAVSIIALTETAKRQAALDASRSVATTRHGPVEYLEWGTGPTVLVIHGAGGGFDQGRLLAEAMGGDGFHWISVSRFGYLGSALPADASVDAQARAFAGLLDQLGLGTTHVLAMSGGVPPALKFAELYPQRSGRMVLLSSAPFTPFGPDVDDRPVPTWMYSALLGNDIVYWTLSRVARRTLEDAFDARTELRQPPIPAEEAFIGQLVDTFLPASKRVPGLANESAAVDPAVRCALETIRSDVLIVHARDDRLNPFHVGEALADRIDSSTFLALDSGGHLLLGHHADLRRKISRHLSVQTP